MPDHPLAEVFGFPTDNMTLEASRARSERLCPFRSANSGIEVPCTKSSREDPLGVCSVFGKDEVAITCPVRFSQDWTVAEDAAEFFFPAGTRWERLAEVPLSGGDGKSAGNIDVVLVAYDAQHNVLDYGALEVQAVYISGNVSDAFRHYMEDPETRSNMSWRGKPKYPRPDYLSSSRKRLAPQLISKGSILNAWGRKMAVALNTGFYETLPKLDEVDRPEADLAWLVYDLRFESGDNRYTLERHRTVYTQFESALLQITRLEAGEEQAFTRKLQTQLDKRLSNRNDKDEISPNDPS